MSNDEFTVIIPSIRPDMAEITRIGLRSVDSVVFDGSNYSSFSKLVNDCIMACPTEIVIICSDKARPDESIIKKMIEMINAGWAFVAMYRFALFGFKKDLIREVGWFDERFYNGGYEDVDFLRRIKMHNLSYYESQECGYIKKVKSTWRPGNKEHLNNKWIEGHMLYKKILAEENYAYDIGPHKGSVFYKWEDKCEMMKFSLAFKSVEVIDASNE